jgi:hypothetical protein
MESNEAIGFFVYAQDLLLLPCRLVCNQASDQASTIWLVFTLLSLDYFVYCTQGMNRMGDGRRKGELHGVYKFYMLDLLFCCLLNTF